MLPEKEDQPTKQSPLEQNMPSLDQYAGDEEDTNSAKEQASNYTKDTERLARKLGSDEAKKDNDAQAAAKH